MIDVVVDEWILLTKRFKKTLFDEKTDISQYSFLFRAQFNNFL